MKDWKILKYKRIYHPTFGFPLGDRLCRNEGEVQSCIQEWKRAGAKQEDIVIEEFKQ